MASIRDQIRTIVACSGNGYLTWLLLLTALLVSVAVIGRAAPAYGAPTSSIYVAGWDGISDYHLYRLSSRGLNQLYQDTWEANIAVNPANGDILLQQRATLELLNSSGQLQRKFYADGDDVNTRDQTQNDSYRRAWDVVWTTTQKIVWSTEYRAPYYDPNPPDGGGHGTTETQDTGLLWSMNPYSDSSGTVVAKPPNPPDPRLGDTTTSFVGRLSMGHDGRILGEGQVLDINPISSDGIIAKHGAWWEYPTDQQTEVWAQYDIDVVGDVCVDAGNRPVLLVHASQTDANAPSRIFVPSTGQSIELGAHARSLACSPDTVDQYAVAMKDGRVLAGGSGGFGEVARVPSGEAYDVDWPGFSTSSDPTANPRVRVTFPKRNHRYSRRSVRRRFKKIRGRVTNSGGVNRVRVSVRRKRGKRCYWLKRRGFKKRSCRKPYYLSAKGISSWKVRLSKRQRRAFKRGRYTLNVRLDDSSGNRMDADGRTRVNFRVKR